MYETSTSPQKITCRNRTPKRGGTAGDVLLYFDQQIIELENVGILYILRLVLRKPSSIIIASFY